MEGYSMKTDRNLGRGSLLALGRDSGSVGAATIPDLLEQSARRWPRKVAFQVKAGRDFRRLSFAELQQRAAEFGAALIALGLRPGDRVAIICENGLEWVVAYLGLVMAGGVGMPLYTELKGAEVGSLIHQAEARFAVVSAGVMARLREHLRGPKIIVVGEEGLSQRDDHAAPAGFWPWQQRSEVLGFEEALGRATEESRLALGGIHVAPDDLASLVYTSGTTGGMKGVMLTHRNFTANVNSIYGTIPFSERDSLLLVLPYHHAYPFTVGLLSPIAYGATVILENNLLRIADRMGEVHPTTFVGVPALYDLMYRAIIGRLQAEGRRELFERGLRLVDAVKRRTGVSIGRAVFRELHGRLGGRLRLIASGGAALNPTTARNFLRLGLPVIQGWGLTEAAPVCSGQRLWLRRFYTTHYYERHASSVGPPLPGVEVALIDVPEKEIYVHLHDEGELVVKGENVSPGYWRSEAATRAARAGDWLRTGDLGRIDEEGNIYITGRCKYVIVLESGEKVHPDELEEKLGQSPLIEDICVVGRKERDKTQVCAVVYPSYAEAEQRAQAQGLSLDRDSLQSLVAAEVETHATDLAPYKRVSRIILTDAPLPKTGALRKVAREQMSDDYSFDVKRWAEQAQQPVV
jgi:long-chain acyl-CoA synthetase